MNLEWDGFGDGTTFGGTLSPNPLQADLTGYTGLRLDFEQHQSLYIRWILGNVDLAGGPYTTRGVVVRTHHSLIALSSEIRHGGIGWCPAWICLLLLIERTWQLGGAMMDAV